jgi:hypothetical protein
MELAIEVSDPFQVARRTFSRFHALILGQSAQLLRILDGRFTGGQTGGMALKHGPQLEYVLGVLLAPASDESALMRHKTQQSFSLKKPQGLPHRRAADLGGSRNFLLCYTGTRGVHTLDDAGSQSIVGSLCRFHNFDDHPANVEQPADIARISKPVVYNLRG